MSKYEAREGEAMTPQETFCYICGGFLRTEMCDEGEPQGFETHDELSDCVARLAQRIARLGGNSMTAKRETPLVSDDEIRDIYYRAQSIAEGGQTIVALVRKRLAERLRARMGTQRITVEAAARIVESD